jgi:NAD(P) transhydrogenase subunit beta
MNSDWHLLIDFAIILILFLGIWRFHAPRTARSGNFAAAFALLCALGVVLVGNSIREPATVVLALLAGGAVGCLVAVRVNMIQIPAMVAFQHGAGGIAAFLTSFVELTRERGDLFAVGRARNRDWRRHVQREHGCQCEARRRDAANARHPAQT